MVKEWDFKLAYCKVLLFFVLHPLFYNTTLWTLSTNKSGLRRHIGFTENFREAAESESRLQYLSAVLLTGIIYAQP